MRWSSTLPEYSAVAGVTACGVVLGVSGYAWCICIGSRALLWRPVLRLSARPVRGGKRSRVHRAWMSFCRRLAFMRSSPFVGGWLPWAQCARLQLLSCSDACFVTRSFFAVRLPADGRIDFRETQLFFKRLRAALAPGRVRYMGVEQYWPHTLRARCLDLIFGYWPSDAVRAGSVFVSRSLERVWGNGSVLVAPVTAAAIDRVCSRSLAAPLEPRFYCSRFVGASVLQWPRPGYGGDVCH